MAEAAIMENGEAEIIIQHSSKHPAYTTPHHQRRRLLCIVVVAVVAADGRGRKMEDAEVAAGGSEKVPCTAVRRRPMGGGVLADEGRLRPSV